MYHKDRNDDVKENQTLNHKNPSKEKAKVNKKEKQFKHGSKFLQNSTVVKFVVPFRSVIEPNRLSKSFSPILDLLSD